MVEGVSWEDYAYMMMYEALTAGNAVAVPLDDALHAVPWTQVTAPDYLDSPDPYRVSLDRWASLEYDRGDIVHIRDQPRAGYVAGRSRLRTAVRVLDTCREVEESAYSTWARGAFPSGVVSVAGRLHPEKRAELRDTISTQFQGAANRGKVLLLDGGTVFSTVGQSAAETQALQSREHQIREVCRVFQVPPPLLQDYSHNTFTNASTAGQWFARFCLRTWVARFESAHRPVLGPGFSLDMSSLVRADFAERWSAWTAAASAGILDAATVRRLEGLDT